MTAPASAKVPFSGARGGQAALTWGQRHIWRASRLHGPGQYFLNCPWVLPVYSRVELRAVLDALRVLLERHESLRTTFHDTPAGPVQRVARTGELTVRLERIGSERTGQERPLELAERLAGQMCEEVIPPGEEWPLHCRVVLAAGRPAALAFGFSHLAVDHEALGLLTADWQRLLRGENLPPASWHPMDQTELEATEPFQIRSAKSIRHWRSVLENVPLDVFDHPPGQPEDPRFVEVGLESAALPAAAGRLAQRWGVSSSSVLLAACATVLAAVTGRQRAVMLLVHGNRRDPRTRTMVGTVGQDSLFTLDLPDDSDFAAICRAAERSALEAYRNTQYDPFVMWQMREETGRRRGREPDLNAFVHDQLGGGLPRPAAGEDPAELTGKTRTHNGHTWPSLHMRVMFTVGATAGAGQLSLIADTAYLPRHIAASMLLGIETLLVRGLTEDIQVADVPRVCGIAAYRGERLRRLSP